MISRKQVVIQKVGAASDLAIIEDKISSQLDDYEILIDVHFSGINFADIVMRLGMYQDAPPRPFTPGYEISGTVIGIGNRVTKVKVGDPVMSGTRFGGYASVVKVPEWQAVVLPSSFSLEEGAATPVTFFTAHLALGEFLRVRKGDKILIDCATGGVGVFCLQIAVAAGAEVFGLTSSHNKKEFIKSFGAKAMTHDEFWKSNEDNFTFILNSTGGKTLKQFYNRLDKGGQLLCIGLQEAIKNGRTSFVAKITAVLQSPWYPILKLMMNSKIVSGFNALKFFDDERWMRKLIVALENNKFKPHVDKIFFYKDVSDAHRYLEEKKAKGKVLIGWKDV